MRGLHTPSRVKPSESPSPAVRRVTLQDIVRCSGFSKFTVSHALRGNRSQVSAATMARVRQVARDLGYDPSTAYQARRLAMQRNGGRSNNKVLGLFFPVERLERLYFRRFFDGLTSKLREEHFNLLLNCCAMSETIEAAMPMVVRGEVDGLVVMASMDAFLPRYRQLRALPGFGTRPIVTVIDSMEGCSAIITDDAAATAAAVGHLLDLGHRRILHFWTDAHPEKSGARRLQGARRACVEHGVDPGAVLVGRAGWAMLDRSASFALLREVFAHDPGITAAMAPNDPGALWIADFLRQTGRRVPEDVSLVGYDDTDPLWNEAHENILTTVHVPLYEIGWDAADLVIRQAEAEAPDPVVQVRHPSLAIRGTTAPVRSS